MKRTKEISFTIYGHTPERSAEIFLCSIRASFSKTNVYSNQFHGTNFKVTPRDKKEHDLVYNRFIKI